LTLVGRPAGSTWFGHAVPQVAAREQVGSRGFMLGQPDDRERWLWASERVARALERFLRISLGIGAVAVFAGGVFLLIAMSGTSAGQGARLAVAVAAKLLLGGIDKQFGGLERRRRPFSMSGPGEAAYRRYLTRSGMLLLLSALVLGGLALLLP